MRRPARSALGQPVRVRPATVSTPTRPTQPATPAPAAPPHDATVPLASLLQAALTHHQGGNHAEAERLYRQVLARDPAQADALHLLGVLAYQVGRAGAAVPLIQQAIERRPGAPGFHLNLGNALLALGRNADAVASYRQATVLAPADPEARYNLGNALIQHGEADAGIGELREAVRLRPEHVLAQYNLGNALREAGHLEEAVAAYAAVVRRQPDFLDAQTNLGTVFHTLGRHDEAQTCFERVLAARPDDPAALVNLAKALREGGQLDAAATRYDLVLSLVPDDATALRGLAAIWQTRGQPAEAAELLGRMVAVTPDDVVAREHYARALIAAALPEMALTSIVSGLERTPDDRALRTELVGLLQTVAAADESPVVRAALLAICKDDTFDVQRLVNPIVRIITSGPEFSGLLAAVRAGLDPLVAGIPLPPTLLAEPAVLAALPRVVICAPDLERVLTALRRSTLLDVPPTPCPSAARREHPSTRKLAQDLRRRPLRGRGETVGMVPPLPLAGEGAGGGGRSPCHGRSSARWPALRSWWSTPGRLSLTRPIAWTRCGQRWLSCSRTRTPIWPLPRTCCCWPRCTVSWGGCRAPNGSLRCRRSTGARRSSASCGSRCWSRSRSTPSPSTCQPSRRSRT